MMNLQQIQELLRTAKKPDWNGQIVVVTDKSTVIDLSSGIMYVTQAVFDRLRYETSKGKPDAQV